jgi:hypothetical protein
MKRRIGGFTVGFIVAATLVSAGTESAAPSETRSAPLMLSFKDLKWTALAGRPGMEIAVLSGDPSSGPYTQMRKVLAGTDNPPHTHSSELTNVVISGVWYTGADTSSAKDFGPGSIVRMPSHWVHVSGCRAGSDCVLYQDGKGPFDYKQVAGSAK